MPRLLESTFLVDFLRRQEEARRLVERMEAEGERLFTTEINAFEVFLGAYPKGRLDHRRFAKAVGLLSRLHVLGLDRAGVIEAAEIAGSLHASGRSIGVLDILTAGIARAAGCKTIVTRDQDFRRIPGLKVETY